MRRSTRVMGLVGLMLCMAAFAVQAGKPVDNDGDGYTNNRDCNDNDPTVWALNSCGECAVEPPGGCGGTTCTDADGDGYAIEGGSCGPVDCDDANNQVWQLNSCGVCAVEPPNGCGTTSSRDVIVAANNDLGMHCACPGAEYFMLLPPFNTLRAQVIERIQGSSPVVLDDPNDIRVEYNIVENTDANLQADPYFSKWIEMMPKYGFGPAINAQGKIQGLTGSTLDGQMTAKTGEGWWEVIGVPAFPDVSNASSVVDKIMTDPLGGAPRNPYLTGNVKVYEQSSGALLAETNTVVPVAFGGCCGCHLQVAADAGLEPTPLNSFTRMGALHERDSGINIASLDPDGDGQPGPVRCSVCHWDPAMGESAPPGGYVDAGGQPLPVSQYTFSDVLHRWHVENSTVATYDPDLATNCYACHPGNGVNCYRGHHAETAGAGGSGPNGEIWCTDCHGDLNQRVAEGQLEQPWSDQTLPSCEDCHRNTGELDPNSSRDAQSYLHLGVFGRYLNSRGHKNDKILCTTCHGSPHALYPSALAKDNAQPIALQGLSSPIGVCTTCHTNKSSSWGTPNH